MKDDTATSELLGGGPWRGLLWRIIDIVKVKYSFSRLICVAPFIQILEKEVHPLLSGFYDTPFIVWLLKTQPKYNSKVFFEDQVGINRHWLEMKWGHEDVETLVTHYAGKSLTSSLLR